MIDMGNCWFDDKMNPTVEYDENGNIKSWIYCPYIPKFLFDGDAQVSTGEDSGDGSW